MNRSGHYFILIKMISDLAVKVPNSLLQNPLHFQSTGIPISEELYAIHILFLN
jgi:hypothetical protein